MAAHRKIVHVCQLDKFIPPFIDFVEEHFDDFATRHVFYIAGDRARYPYKARKNTVHAGAGKKGTLKHLSALAKAIHCSEKVILHGLFSARYVQLLLCMPWVHKKCYWVIWGGDLYNAYHHQPSTWKQGVNTAARRVVIRRIGNLVTYLPEDVELARRWYGARGQHIECLMYESNTFTPVESEFHAGKPMRVLVGNSATPTNNHRTVFERLAEHDNGCFEVIVPLAYGDGDYAQEVCALGTAAFGERFQPILQLMPLPRYLELLATVDIAVFAHDRQQGMGNIVTLLGMGKRVYMRTDLSSSRLFTSLGVTVYDVDALSLTEYDGAALHKNAELVPKYFSRERLVQQLHAFCG